MKHCFPCSKTILFCVTFYFDFVSSVFEWSVSCSVLVTALQLAPLPTHTKAGSVVSVLPASGPMLLVSRAPDVRVADSPRAPARLLRADHAALHSDRTHRRPGRWLLRSSWLHGPWLTSFVRSGGTRLRIAWFCPAEPVPVNRPASRGTGNVVDGVKRHCNGDYCGNTLQ